MNPYQHMEMFMDSTFTLTKQSEATTQILRHKEVREKLGLSESKLFDMVAKGLFPKPFPIIPGGRAVGWLSTEVDHWIIERQRRAAQGITSK
jgi:prophage regulatory protein